jgi:hypothetical protein
MSSSEYVNVKEITEVSTSNSDIIALAKHATVKSSAVG